VEGPQAAAAKGNHGGRPKVIDDDMLLFARALHDQDTSMPDIVARLTIKTGKNAANTPRSRRYYRALGEAGARHVTSRHGGFCAYLGPHLDLNSPQPNSDAEAICR
jgi:hypothetical protein